jgi:Protein of unknown function (DUF3761)
MIKKLAGFLLAVALSIPAISQPLHAQQQDQSAAQSKQKGKKKSGNSSQNASKNATAKCKDGTYSYAKRHQGACSHHGGVAEWYK